MLLAGKTVVVSGVGAGLGHRIAATVVRDGGNAVLGARTEANLVPSRPAEIDPDGPHTAHRATDITDEAQCEALAALARRAVRADRRGHPCRRLGQLLRRPGGRRLRHLAVGHRREPAGHAADDPRLPARRSRSGAARSSSSVRSRRSPRRPRCGRRRTRRRRARSPRRCTRWRASSARTGSGSTPCCPAGCGGRRCRRTSSSPRTPRACRRPTCSAAARRADGTARAGHGRRRGGGRGVPGLRPGPGDHGPVACWSTPAS